MRDCFRGLPKSHTVNFSIIPIIIIRSSNYSRRERLPCDHPESSRQSGTTEGSST
jgi:hypothetical protein